MDYILIGLSIFLIMIILTCLYLYNVFQSKITYYQSKCPDYWENTSNLNETGSSGCYVSANKINKGKCATTENVDTNYCHSTTAGGGESILIQTQVADEYGATNREETKTFGPSFNGITPVGGIYNEEESDTTGINSMYGNFPLNAELGWSSDPLAKLYSEDPGAKSDNWNQYAYSDYKTRTLGYNPYNANLNTRNKAGFTYDVFNAMSSCDKFNWANKNAIAWNGITNNHKLKKQCK